jgi:enediyne biosynthesis protein E4
MAPMAGAVPCGPCHQAVVQSYLRTAHFLTSDRANAQSIRGNFGEGHNILRTASPDVHFVMERRDDAFYQTAFDHGKTRSERFDLTIGSGQRGQSYLYWKNGLLYQLPVSYFALTGEWINSPGYPDGEVHFDRMITLRCLECHATEGARAGQFLPGILCRKCHGTAEQHPAIRNPAALDRDRQVALCAACHSGLGSRAAADVHGNQVALLQRSECYRNSSAMSCSTCHNIHRVERDLAGMSARCTGCHAAPRHTQKVAADNCIDCHMPRQQSKVITFQTAGTQTAQLYRTHDIAVYDDHPDRQAGATATPAQGPVQFVDVAAEAGLTFRHENGASQEKYMFETFGSGVGVIDFDNDGLPDLFFANGADLAHGKRSPGNVLYRNLGNGRFEDVTAKAGVAGNGMFATGVTVGDYDNDGFLDIYVTGYGGNQLFHNNGNGTFSDVTARAGVGGSGWSSSAAWVDYDRDGYLDLFVARYVDYDMKMAPYCGYKKDGYRMYCDPQQFDGVTPLLFHNNRDGTFTEVSRKAGVANPAGKGLGVAIGDVDGDGWPDIFVTNDGVRNFLFHNKGNGSFDDITYSAGVGFDMNGKALNGMGVEIADLDGDGMPDIFFTAFSRQYNPFFRNLGKLLFEDNTIKSGLPSSIRTLGFGAKVFDFDNDGLPDLYVTNGHVTDNVNLYDPQLSYREADLLYRNTGGGHFRDVSAESGPAFRIQHVGRGLAVADFDNDGDLDLVVADLGGRPLLLRNDGGNRNHWIGIRARGRESNRFGIGSKVRVTSGGRTQLREINPYGSYLSTSDVRLYFGLGGEVAINHLEIEWPSGKRQVLENVRSDQILLIDEANAGR